jgi:hypothetical protein
MGGRFIFFLGDELPALIELPGQLLIHEENVMHLSIKVRITVFEVIPDPERFDRGFLKERMDSTLRDR